MDEEGVSEFIGFSAPGKQFHGVEVIVKGEPLKPNEQVNVPDSEPLAYVGHVLEALKLPRSLRRDMSQPENLIIVQFEGGIP